MSHLGIVCGAGPALEKYKHLEILAKSKFKGEIVLTDKVFAKALEMGITPKKFKVTVVSSEYGNDIHLHYFKPIIDKLAKGCKAWIYTPDNQVTEYLTKCGVEVHTWPGNGYDAYANSLANVGAIAWMTAWKYLHCDKLALIGMNQSYHMSWADNFPKHYIGKLLKVGKSLIDGEDYILDPLYDYYHKSFLFFLEQNHCETINCTGEGSIDRNCKFGKLESFLLE